MLTNRFLLLKQPSFSSGNFYASQLSDLWLCGSVCGSVCGSGVYVLLSPGLLPAGSLLTSLCVTSTPGASPDTDSMTHGVKTTDPAAKQPVGSEP